MHDGKALRAGGDGSYLAQLVACVSDWRITSRSAFGWRGREAGGRFTHSVPLGKTRRTLTPCEMTEKDGVYTETKTHSHTTVHTKTHTPTFMGAAHRVLLFLQRLQGAKRVLK